MKNSPKAKKATSCMEFLKPRSNRLMEVIKKNMNEIDIGTTEKYNFEVIIEVLVKILNDVVPKRSITSKRKSVF